MREASFLSQNENKWRKVEEIINDSSQLSPDEAAALFSELTDDLAYAQTHYGNSKTTRYLNALAVGVFQKLNRSNRERFNRLLRFWRQEVPLAVSRHLSVMLFVFIFFIMTVAIGVISTHYDESFPRTVLGDDYVDMTIENIQSGDPMAVYKGGDSNLMFMRITLNNIRVASYTFAAGILFSLGSLYYLFVNGVMLGTFQYFFVTQNLFIDSFLAIWIHGTLEISAIIIAGTAGVVLGNSVLFPGSFPRKESVKRGAKEALKIFIGIVPIIIIAGFLEGFVTRLTEAPTLLRLVIIFGSLVFILWYFVYYPMRLAKRN